MRGRDLRRSGIGRESSANVPHLGHALAQGAGNRMLCQRSTARRESSLQAGSGRRDIVGFGRGRDGNRTGRPRLSQAMWILVVSPPRRHPPRSRIEAPLLEPEPRPVFACSVGPRPRWSPASDSRCPAGLGSGWSNAAFDTPAAAHRLKRRLCAVFELAVALGQNAPVRPRPQHPQHAASTNSRLSDLLSGPDKPALPGSEAIRSH